MSTDKITQVIKKIKKAIGNHDFDVWLDNADFKIKNNELIIYVGTEFAKDWIKKRKYTKINSVVNYNIDIKCDESLNEDLDNNNEEDNFKEEYTYKNVVDPKEKLINSKRISNFKKEDEIEKEEVDISNVLRDIDKSSVSASIPRSIYFNIIKEDFNKLNTKYNKGKLTKVDLLVYIALAFNVNSNQGIVKNVTVTRLAEYINHNSHSKVLSSINKLESLNMIKVNRNIKPFQYTIKQYEEAIESGSNGMVNITYNLFKELTDASLRQIRGVFWLVNHRYHLEIKEAKFIPNLSSLKEVMNARSYREVIELMSELEGKIFKLIDKLKDSKILRPFDKFRSAIDKVNNNEKMSIIFNKKKLGIGSFIKPSKDIVNTVIDTLKSVDIPTTRDNIRKASGLAAMLPDFIVKQAKDICSKKDIKSKKETVSFYTGLLQKLYNK